MPSILPGFEYDIFISYRQKDNKYDGWVTEFVTNLKKELEATFKEDVSIYFDINPHDGLLETHQVNQSLEGKLKCLIFIPIISQTYCDPKSFAWQHEFCAFNQRSKEDTLGRDIKLSNGNVTSRILPVKIHNLDEEDKSLVEGELGGVLRSIEFIYKSAGVNRPLRVTEDHPQDNLNKTYYRDQLNKVANAVKEIIVGLKKLETKKAGLSDDIRKKVNSVPQPGMSRRKWLASAAAVLLVFLGFGYFFVLPNFNGLKDPGISGVAILPFRNFTGSEELNFYGVGMASEIRTKLSMSKQFSFISSLQATLAYTDTKKTPKEIGNELGVDYLLSGLYQKAGSKIKVEIELIDASTGRAVWTLPVESELTDIFEVQSGIARDVLKQFSSNALKTESDKAPTKNLEAYAHYIRGHELQRSPPGDNFSFSQSFNPSIQQFEKAVELDSGFIDAWAGLIEVECFVFLNEPNDTIRKGSIERHVAYVENHFSDSWQKKLVQAQYEYRVLHNFDKALTLFNQVLQEVPENLNAIGTVSGIYRRKLEFAKALHFGQKSINLDPAHQNHWGNFGNILSSMGDGENAIKAYTKAWSFSHTLFNALIVLNFAVSYNFPLDELPAQLIKDCGPDGELVKWSNARDWHKITKASFDPAKTNVVYWKSIAYWMLGDVDSSRYWAKKITFNKLSFFALQGDRKNALAEIDKIYKELIQTGDDKERLCYKILDEIYVCTLLGDYKEATEKLIEVNNRYPDFADYMEYNTSIYDKIKKEYPPFVEALNNLKRKPMIDISKTIKL